MSRAVSPRTEQHAPSLQDVLATEELSRRPVRTPDYARETRALHAVARALGASPRAALDALTRQALALCGVAGNATAGVSLLERDDADGEERFRWTSMAGRLGQHVGGSTPRHFSPCGVCLDERRAVLFRRPDLYFTYFLATGVPFIEGLVLPFEVEGEYAGTIWIVSHDGARRFDAEDVRLMSSLADFTGVVYSQLRAREAADEARADRERLLREAEELRARAEEANRAKTQFIAVMSHELRTPLSAVGGYAELIELGLHGPLTAEQREDLARIQQSHRQIVHLVNEVLNYTRIERGTIQYELSAVAVSQAIELAEALVIPQLRARGVRCERHDCDRTLHVKADADRLQQILLNLLTNAVKFTEPGGSVTIACRASGPLVAISVADTGIGIAPDKLTRIFEPFVQGDDEITHRRQGLGLGLAISRDLARGMSGDLVVQSSPGVGSTFTLTLPRA